jgi:predicted ATPase
VIRALHIANFRSLGGDVSVEFSAQAPHLVVLAGTNGAGKSNTLDAFRFLRTAAAPRGLTAAVQQRGGVQGLLRHGTSRAHFVVEAVFGDDWVVWGLELGPWGVDDFAVWDEALFVNPMDVRDGVLERARQSLDAESDERVPEFPRALVQALAGRAQHDAHTMRLRVGPVASEGRRHELSVTALRRFDPSSPESRLCVLLDTLAVYSLAPDALRSPQLRSTEPLLTDHGDNWMSVLLRMQPDDRAELLAGLGALVPDLVDLRVEPAGDHLVAVFEHGDGEGAYPVPANRESDGTLRTAVMLTALLQDPAPSLIAIEEPELAVHVRAMSVLRDYLVPRAMTTPVLLSTHSGDLLDLLPVDAVRVVDRSDGQTSVRALSARQRGLVDDGVFTLGQLLLAQPLEGQTRG